MAQLHSAGRESRGIALVLSCWRSFYRWLGNEGLVGSNPVQDVHAPKAARPLPKALAVDEAVQLADLHDADADPWAEARDRAIVELLYGCGLRVGELDGPRRAGQQHGARLGRPRRARGQRAGQGQQAPHRAGGRARRPRRSRPGWRCAATARRSKPRGCAIRRAPRRSSSAATARASRRSRSGSSCAQRSLKAGPGGAGASAHAAPFVRQPRAAVQQRPARGAGAAGPRQHHDHAGLHAAGFPASGQGLRRRASARAGARRGAAEQTRARTRHK